MRQTVVGRYPGGFVRSRNSVGRRRDRNEQAAHRRRSGFC